jgi:hypothetical protein
MGDLPGAGLSAVPSGVQITGQFDVNELKDGGAAARSAVAEVCQPASQVLLVLEEHPLTHEKRQTDLAHLRRSFGETRAVDDAPGHMLRRHDGETLTRLLELCIGRGSWWSAYLYLAPTRTTMLVWESSIVDLWSDRHSDYRVLERQLPTLGAK